MRHNDAIKLLFRWVQRSTSLVTRLLVTTITFSHDVDVVNVDSKIPGKNYSFLFFIKLINNYITLTATLRWPPSPLPFAMPPRHYMASKRRSPPFSAPSREVSNHHQTTTTWHVYGKQQHWGHHHRGQRLESAWTTVYLLFGPLAFFFEDEKGSRG